MFHPLYPIGVFMHAGSQPTDGSEFSKQEILQYLARTGDEVEETFLGIQDEDLVEILDGFIDTAYVALTGAIRAVGYDKARLAWDAVVDANLAKVDGRHGPVVIDNSTGKILKPEGWTAPDIEGIING